MLSARPCPGGTCDNSPTFQRWVDTPNPASPEGTVEIAPLFSRPFGTCLLRDLDPNAKALGYFQASLRDETAMGLLSFPEKT